MSGPGSKEYVDGMLVDWGASLFNQGSVSAMGGGQGAKGLLPKRSAKKASAGGVLKERGAIAQSAAMVRSKLGAIARRSPEVMVKITAVAPKGMRQIKRAMDYISRKGEIELEDQDGNVVKGKEALDELRDDWQHGGAYIADEPGKRREAFHLVLSMPEGTDELAVRRAVRDFALGEFQGHQYVMAMHTFDTDPDPEPAKQPHVHVVVKARGDDTVRLAPRKADLQRWREGFAEALREHGVDAAASNRLQRLQRRRGEKQAVRQIRADGRELTRIGRSKASPERVQRAKELEKRAIEAYRQLGTALANSEDVDDRRLAIQLVKRLAEDQEVVKLQRNLREPQHGFDK